MDAGLIDTSIIVDVLRGYAPAISWTVELTPSDYIWATEQLVRLNLSHSVGINDCLIAAPAYRLQVPLYTQNLKYFAPLLGVLAQKPY